MSQSAIKDRVEFFGVMETGERNNEEEEEEEEDPELYFYETKNEYGEGRKEPYNVWMTTHVYGWWLDKSPFL